MTQQNAALVEESAATSKTMSDQAEALNEMVGFFQLSSPESPMQSNTPHPLTAKNTSNKSQAPQPKTPPPPPAFDNDDDWSEF